MRIPVLSNNEKNFLLAALLEKKRLDGRDLSEFRNLEIHFGSDLGCSYVSLGETKVLAQVTVDIDEPRLNRPNEGMLYFNLEYGPMANLGSEPTRQNTIPIHVNRFLEKLFRESRCLDLESLCIISEEQVWVVRVVVTVLNNDGGLTTCCSIAVLAALAHFKTPFVTIEDGEAVIHSIRERQPSPLSINHFPIAITYAVCNDGGTLLLDPTEIEEKVSDGELIVGMNHCREICALHFTGSKAVVDKTLVLSYAHQTAAYASEIVKRIRQAVEEDTQKRISLIGEGDGLASCVFPDRLLAGSQDRSSLRLTAEEVRRIFEGGDDGIYVEEEDKDEHNHRIELLRKMDDMDNGLSNVMKVAELSSYGQKSWEPSGGKSTWLEHGGELDSEEDRESSEEDSSSSSDVEITGTITDADRIVDNIELSGDSEEEETLTLKGCDIEES